MEVEHPASGPIVKCRKCGDGLVINLICTSGNATLVRFEFKGEIVKADVRFCEFGGNFGVSVEPSFVIDQLIVPCQN